MGERTFLAKDESIRVLGANSHLLMSPPKPPNETARLEALKRYGILDTLPEQEYEDIVLLAATLCRTPMALISLIDAERQWLKARLGVDVQETSRDLAFCAYTILGTEPLIVPDATKDERFASNPFVSEGGIRYYVGVPLLTREGHALGSLCVVDLEPRELDPEQLACLSALSRQLMVILESRLQRAEIQEANEALQRSQDLLAQARDAALQSARLKAEFLANMSHEIRTPLNGVLGMLQLLQDTELTDPQRDFAQSAYSSGESLLTLINDILDFSKIEAGKLDFEIQDFDLQEVVGGAVELLAQEAARKGLELAVAIDPRVPRRLQGDAGRLRQILVNLVGNAVKFTRAGEIVTSVTLERWEAGRAGLRFSVRDTGIGMPPEALPRVFHAFEQADGSTTRKFGGTGLGLSICRRLVELMGGEIGVTSEMGKGSTFWFTLTLPEQPVAAEATPVRPSTLRASIQSALDPGGIEAPGRAVAPGPPAVASPKSKLKVLLAEDNPVNVKVGVLQLGKLGYAAAVAGNGLEAVEACERMPFDVILMDVQMPEMDGYEATRAIRAAAPAGASILRPYIIAMTANAMKGDREACLEAGMNDYLSKPVRPGELGEAMARAEAALAAEEGN